MHWHGQAPFGQLAIERAQLLPFSPNPGIGRKTACSSTTAPQHPTASLATAYAAVANWFSRSCVPVEDKIQKPTAQALLLLLYCCSSRRAFCTFSVSFHSTWKILFELQEQNKTTRYYCSYQVGSMPQVQLLCARLYHRWRSLLPPIVTAGVNFTHTFEYPAHENPPSPDPTKRVPFLPRWFRPRATPLPAWWKPPPYVVKTGRACPSGALRRGTSSAVPCRMSASPANNNDGDGDETENAVGTAPSNNPFLVAAVGMALLSSDPAATLAAQSARGAVLPGAPPASPVLVLSAATPTTGDPGLKDLLGEVSLFRACRHALLGWGRLRPLPGMVAFLSIITRVACFPCPP